jgi:hypothetical protein
VPSDFKCAVCIHAPVFDLNCNGDRRHYYFAMTNPVISCEEQFCPNLAIYRCDTCRRALCGTHRGSVMTQLPGGIVAGEWVPSPVDRCAPCQTESQRAYAAQRAREEAEQFALREMGDAHPAAIARQEQSELAVAAMLTVADDCERLLTACSCWTSEGTYFNTLGKRGNRPTTWLWAGTPHQDRFSLTFPDLWPTPESVDFDSVTQPWDSNAILEWYIPRAIRGGLQPVPSRGAPKQMFKKLERFWTFPAAEWQRKKRLQVVITEGRPIATDMTLSSLALLQMAVSLGLTEPSSGSQQASELSLQNGTTKRKRSNRGW